MPTTVESARAGDRAAAETLVRRVGRIALPLAISVVGDRELAGDVAQDVAVDVLRGLPRLREPERFDAWVRRIAVRHSLRAAKKRRRFRRLEVPLGEVVESDHGDSSSEDDVAARQALRVAIATLAPRQRIALALRYVHGLSDAEIATALGCRPGTAASLLSRARAALLRHISASGPATPVSGGL